MDRFRLRDNENYEKSGASHLVRNAAFVIFGFVVVLFILSALSFRVNETQQAAVARFGEVKKIVVSSEDLERVQKEIKGHSKLKNVVVVGSKGFHWKLPFVDDVTYFSDRLLTYDTVPREVTTLDKKKLVLDNYAQWKITNPAVFKVSLKNVQKANARLDDFIYSNLNKEIGRTDAHDIISDMEIGKEMLANIVEDTNKEIKQYGMQLEDVRIRRTEYPKENFESIFERMRTERERIANQYRSQGEKEARKITSAAEKDAKIIKAAAYRESEVIRGEGDAEASKIYSDAYNQDPEFYKFYRSLMAYETIVDEQTTLVLPADSELAAFLFNMK
ncbi:protease modulator HflC (plasmid) [Pontibacillus sp. ALD_SL1]|uniref:protease modulator HflC n=1 Tax=Pontibacillus sp. ALD_SL1 TaxID=2777185 RepID=UPI001A975319|nr:protease modulator HflC [Pontibacillus sp. ALD_SL1]QST02060.1 protease modulator HflC [Pontibacillus sp. ALD_SL1]